MSRIDENLLRKRCEHNEGEIGTLEELSLHQEDLEKLEHLQHWCKDLKILLLHSNLIPKIENIGKLKKLEYINFSLNNIETIENLEGCESLKKIDLTLNFIGNLLSVEKLKANIFLETLYLTGNPCTDYKGYRDFVIATLTQLKELDGREITITERILALRKIDKLKPEIIQQQNKYREKREMQKKEYRNGIIEDPDDFDQDKIEEYWSEKSENTPEIRREIAINSRKARESGKKEEKIEKRVVKLFDKDGKPLNVNQAKIPFILNDDEENNQYILDVAVYRYLDTNLLDVDVEAKYVRVKIKEKLFQITLMEEVSSDKSTAQRSQTTGHLVITMPKAKEFIQPKFKKNKELNKKTSKNKFLEFEPQEDMDFSKIVERSNTKNNTTDDIDESEIPPLEDIDELL